MTWVAGVDGCRKGWFRACRHSGTGELRFDVVESARELLARAPEPTVLAVDIPIGLPASGPRPCDRAARSVLGARRSSVFPAPIRPAISAAAREEASRIAHAIDGRKLSIQAWAISPKIREVDALLRGSARARRSIWEVHPEVSFWAWNGERPMGEAKKKRAGLRARLSLVEAWLGKGTLDLARGPHLEKHLADDDILDAIAALWTAERIARGEGIELPEEADHDECGLPMRIVY